MESATVSAIVDNREIDSPIPPVPILHGMQGLDNWLLEQGDGSDIFFALAIGGDRGRDRLAILDALKDRGLTPLTLLHRSAYCAKNLQIGEGSQVLANSTVCTHVQIGSASIINTAASVDHDVKIGNGVHIGPGACLAGEITVDDYAFVGAGAVVLPRIHIGKGSVVGAGAVVTKNVPAGLAVVGNPARIYQK